MLLSEADKLIRKFMPVVFDATGNIETAKQFRNLHPLDHESIEDAGYLFEKVRLKTFDDRFHSTLLDACFWSEAAMWAAFEDDKDAFINHLTKARNVLEIGLNRRVRN